MPKHKYTPEQQIKALWNQVNKNGSIPMHCPELGMCWEWTGHTNKKGYGEIRIHGIYKRVHRTVWVLFNGLIPDGLWVLHKCDNRKCCNPSHLFLGTHADNMRDMVTKNRQNKGVNAPKGEDNGNHKFSDKLINEIRERYMQGGIKQSELVKEYGISKSHISVIVKNQSRKG